MYTAPPDFVYTVSRDFVRSCQTPMLVMPDDSPGHPYAVAMEIACARAEVRGEHLSLEGPQGPDPQGGATGARVPPGASARDGLKEGAAMNIGVLALVGVTPERMAALTAAGYAVREGKKYANRIDAVREAGDTVRAVLTNGRGGLSGDEMALLPNLEIVCTGSAGYEAVDLDTARRRGIAVANCPDTNASAVADSAMMLLMAATRHLLQADRFVRAGGWQDQWRVDTPTISGKRLGILGLGTIGSRIAHRAARGFDMEIGYHNRKAVTGSSYRYFDSLIELATWADFLICAAPGGAGTRHLVNADVLTALGPQGYLVNVGRGTVVDTAGPDRCAAIEAHCGGWPGCPRGRTERTANTSGASAMRQRGGHAACRRTRAGVAHRGDRVDSRQLERVFCGQAASVSGLVQRLSRG